MDGVKFYWFDMDHTLINNDCDVSWKEFVVEHSLASANALEQAAAFFEDYNKGVLDSEAFLKFQLEEFAGKSQDEMAQLARNHFVEYVLDAVYLKAKAFITDIQENGGRVGILTATNTVLAAPVAEYFKADLLLGTVLEVGADGKFTGGYVHPYAGGKGKVEMLSEFARAVKIDPSELAYFGDSINDRDVLEYVGHPVATNPSTELRNVAEANRWEIISFQDN